MQIFSYIKTHSVIATTVAVLVVVTTVITGRVSSAKHESIAPDSNIKRIALVDAGTFLNGTSTISADGTVESVSQVDLKSQVSAPVASEGAAVGDTVYAGETLIQLQNADIRAQLDQAKASLALAMGQYGSSGVSLDSAKRTAVDKIRSSYQSADDIVNVKIDQFLFNNVGGDPSLGSYVSDYRLLDRLHSARTDLSNYFIDWKKMVDALSTSSPDADIFAALAKAKTVFATISQLLDDMSTALNTSVKNTSASAAVTINSWKGTVTAERGATSASLADLTVAENAISGALSSHGSSAEAQVSIAQSGVKSLEAQLAKTYIVSPISGKLAALPLRVGELASPGALLATVVGGGGIQVKAYASGEDFSRIEKGARATFQGGVLGTVQSVAPSVNETNKKVEVTILVTDAARSGLVIGQSVPVAIAASASSVAAPNSDSKAYRLPIQDIRIIPGDAYVFTLDSSSKLVKHAVVLGNVDGDFVEVKSGLTSDMKIVSPVYGLEEGQTVALQ